MIFFYLRSNAPLLCGGTCCRLWGNRRGSSSSSSSRGSRDGAAPPLSPLLSLPLPRSLLRSSRSLPPSLFFFFCFFFSCFCFFFLLLLRSSFPPPPPPQLPLERRPAQGAERWVLRAPQQRRVAGAARRVPAWEDDGLRGRDVGLEADRAQLERRGRERGGRRRCSRRQRRRPLSPEGAVGPPLSSRGSGRLLLRRRLGPRVSERLHGEGDEGDGERRAAAAGRRPSSSPPVVAGARAAAGAAKVIFVVGFIRLRTVPALVYPPRAGGLCQLLRRGAIAYHAAEGPGLFWRVLYIF